MGLFKALGTLVVGAGCVIAAPIVLPAAAAAGAALAGGAAVAAGTVAGAATAAGTAIAGAATAAGTAIAGSAVGTAVGSGMAAVGTTVGAAANAVGLTSVATIAGTAEGATAVGVITSSAAVGTTGAASGAVKTSKAKDIINEAKKIAGDERKKYDEIEKLTNTDLESLGKLKIQIWKRFLDFEESYNKIKNLEIAGSARLDHEFHLDKDRLEDVHVLAFTAKDIMMGGAASIAGGQLAGLAASATITNSAVAGLHGVAAANHGLAVLGGGAKAAGGLGMAGGAAVVKALAFAPSVAIGGILLNAKGSQSLKDAEESYSEAEKVVRDLKAAEKELEKIRSLTQDLTRVLNSYDAILAKLVSWLAKLVERETDALNYSDEEITKCYATFRLVEILHSLTTEELYSVNSSGKPVVHTIKVQRSIEHGKDRWKEYETIAA